MGKKGQAVQTNVGSRGIKSGFRPAIYPRINLDSVEGLGFWSEENSIERTDIIRSTNYEKNQ